MQELSASKFIILSMIASLWVATPILGRKRRQHDYNYKPSFTNSPLILERYENTIEGFLLADISQYAKDDEGDKILYKLDTAGEEICTIGQTDGKLKLKIRPDREQKQKYSFKVIVSDSFEGGLNREAYLNVYLYILDENDNKPIFKETPYHVDIAENAKVGTELIRITASDNDAGRNKAIRYIFKGDKEYEEFDLHPTTGVLTLKTSLDYEKITSYTLEVEARDGGSPALAEETKIVINVIDVDDMKPYFVLHQYVKEIRENIPIGSQIAIVSAKDGDKGINAEINYRIVAGDVYGLFHVDRKTGNVTVKGVLDREFYAKFTLQIEAYEAENIDSYARIHLNIKLLDVNDNKPKFEHDHYTFELNEFELNPERIISREIRAHDEDVTWRNNFITYWMDENQYFEIISEAGTLIQKGDLKLQEKDHFTFFVYATERETKERYTAKTSVDIHLERPKREPNVVSSELAESASNNLSMNCLLTLVLTVSTLLLTHVLL